MVLFNLILQDSGLPLDLAIRYQINMVMNNVDNIDSVRKFSNTVIPMLWTENVSVKLDYYFSNYYKTPYVSCVDFRKKQ